MSSTPQSPPTIAVTSKQYKHVQEERMATYTPLCVAMCDTSNCSSDPYASNDKIVANADVVSDIVGAPETKKKKAH